jgi:hypothetical protein
MLKIYVYGYINQIQSSRRLERETARNVEMMWLTGRLTPDFKTIADFRKDNGGELVGFVERISLGAVAAFDGSVHLRRARRQDVQGDALGLAGGLELGHELASAVDLDGLHRVSSTMRSFLPHWNGLKGISL